MSKPKPRDVADKESPSRKKKAWSDEGKTPSDTVLAAGAYYYDKGGALYCVDTETGKALAISSPAFKARVAKIAAIGRKHKDFAALFADVEDGAREKAKLARVEHCSAYIREDNTFLVNLGAGYIAKVSPTSIFTGINGRDGVVFVDEDEFAPLDPKAVAAYGTEEALAIVRASVLDFPPLMELAPVEAEAVVLAYWIGFFFDRKFARARPLLLFVGDPESGKTMCSRKLGRVFYGPEFEVSVTASPDRGIKDLAASVAYSTLTVRDDLNSAPSGLIDLLLCIATGGKFDMSTFHETLARQSVAMVGNVVFTASKAKWAKRADLLSRLLVVRVRVDDSPRAVEEGEGDRLDRADKARNAAWCLVLYGLQAVLQSNERPKSLTRFRDWEHGARTALKALGLHDPFVGALGKMKAERMRLAVAADPFLALLLAVALEHPGREWKAAALSDALGRAAGMKSKQFDVHVGAPRGAKELGELLAHIEREGGAVVRVERAGQAHGNTAKWILRPVDMAEVEKAPEGECRKCETMNAPTARFCNQCGASMLEENVIPFASKATQQRTKAEKRR